jgi:hypothetical protein
VVRRHEVLPVISSAYTVCATVALCALQQRKDRLSRSGRRLIEGEFELTYCLLPLRNASQSENSTLRIRAGANASFRDALPSAAKAVGPMRRKVESGTQPLLFPES